MVGKRGTKSRRIPAWSSCSTKGCPGIAVERRETRDRAEQPEVACQRTPGHHMLRELLSLTPGGGHHERGHGGLGGCCAGDEAWGEMSRRLSWRKWGQLPGIGLRGMDGERGAEPSVGEAGGLLMIQNPSGSWAQSSAHCRRCRPSQRAGYQRSEAAGNVDGHWGSGWRCPGARHASLGLWASKGAMGGTAGCSDPPAPGALSAGADALLMGWSGICDFLQMFLVDDKRFLEEHQQTSH